MSKERNTKNRRQKAKGRMVTLLVALFTITFGSILFGSIFSSAHGDTLEEPVMYKYYKSIEIQRGDSLWSIANEYMTDDYGSVQEYIDELKQINSLYSDTIHEGQSLMVAYYDTEMK